MVVRQKRTYIGEGSVWGGEDCLRPVADPCFSGQLCRMIRQLCALVVVGALASACGREPAATEQRQIAAPASSWVPPETCLPQASTSLADLDRKTDDELRRLADHYFSCVDDQRLSAKGALASLEVLARRGDARSAGGLAAIYKYKPQPDRVRSVQWAKEAARLGDPRGEQILKEWRADDTGPPPPASRSVCVSPQGQVREARGGKCA